MRYHHRYSSTTQPQLLSILFYKRIGYVDLMVELALAMVVQNQVFWMQGRLSGDIGIRNCLVGSKLA